MKKLSKEKRNQLILVAMGTVAAIAGLWYGLINYQRGKLQEVARKSADLQKEIDKTQKVVRDASQVDAALKEATAKLSVIETSMPAGDLFSWTVSRLKQFNVPSYKVNMPQIGLPVIGEVAMFPSFPYHQADVAVGGTAYYYDLGKFLADFENQFPYARIQNLFLEPGGGEEKEQLTFRMEILNLVKSSNAQSGN
ncbi:MAG: hypothetical protein JWR69_2764 [Pedosphaera sp.]|nr:hypothetical protein [Pedosphaera sp.]